MCDLYDIPNYETWTKIEPVLKGWSSDEKFYVEDQEGRKLLLRLSSNEDLERKQREFDIIQRVNQLELPMSRVIDLGVCSHGRSIYMLLTWVEGCSLQDCLRSFTQTKQYELGVEAGRMLKLIHSIPNPTYMLDWENELRSKLISRVEQYESCPYRVKGDEAAIAFVRENIGLLSNLQRVYRHGDFHIGNLIYTDQGQIGLIDFNRCDIGDYVEEFYKLQAFDREWSVPFSRGKLDGYFEGTPPEDFWKRHTLYVAYSSLYSIVWAIPYGLNDVEGMLARCEVAFEDYDHFTRIIPRWYTEEQMK